MDAEKPQDNLSTKSLEESSDPIVIAYRVGEALKTRQIVRVRRSELLNDPNLFEISRSSRSVGFDPEKSLKTTAKIKRAADPHVVNKIEYYLMRQEHKARIKKGLTLESLPANLKIESVEDQAAQQILALVTNQLIKEGLWLDEYQDLTMSEAFPLAQTKVDMGIRGDQQVFEHGCLTDSDLTHEDFSAEILSAKVNEHLEHMRRPVFASPMIYNLMRSRPRDLYHQLARRMIDTNYFEDHVDQAHLYRACYFASRGVEDEAHFNVLMDAGLGRDFPHYTFQSFRIERVSLRKVIRPLIDGFFLENRTVKNSLMLRSEPEKQNPKNIWARFYDVWTALTAKQREALDLVYLGEPQRSRKEIAQKLGLSINSLKSRLQIAVTRFKSEFWEFDGITPKGIARRLLKPTITHNGLWRYQSAARKAPLYKVDLESEAKFEIVWNKLPRSKNLDWKSIARIKAEIIESCPVPHFHETEYFDEMKPTIVSWARSGKSR